MTTRKALNGKPYAGNTHVRFDEREVVSAAMPRRGSLLYRTALAIICIVSALGAVGADNKVAPRKTSLSESELRAMGAAVPDIKIASTLYRVAMATSNNVERKEAYLKGAAACLFACNKNDVYQKYIKDKIQNAAKFEDRLKDVCKKCSGRGGKDIRCYVCGGNGRCSSCRGSGRTVSVGFDRPNRVKPCHKCGGRGYCPKCRGKGSVRGKCDACSGTGKVFSKAVAERVFHDACDAIADNMEAELRAKVEAEKRERERIAAEAREKAEAEERKRRLAEERKKQEKIRKVMEDLGLENVYGKWMTPGSVRSVSFVIFQIYEPGHALCKSEKGIVFCLLYDARSNRNIAEGDVYTNDLYRCGTYSYIDVQNAARTVRQYAIDLEVALREIKKQNRETM